MAIESHLNAKKQNSFNKDKANSSFQQIQLLQQRCLNLERLIMFTDISTVPHVVHDFKAMSQFYLLQLAKEIESYRFCPDERAELIDFLDYLHSVTHEIEDLLLIEKE
jgi:hypothetical protein